MLNEYSTYKLNKGSKDISYSSVDDIKVFEFLDELYALPSNNPIAKFEIASDITTFLREQFAGLFHRFLQEQKRLKEMRVLEEMNSVAKTLKELVGFLTDERKNKDEAIKSILLANHPCLPAPSTLDQDAVPGFLLHKKEMQAWLGVRGWRPVEKDRLDTDSVEEWWKEAWKKHLKFKKNIFDKNGKLLPHTDDNWSAEWIELVPETPKLTEDDIPF